MSPLASYLINHDQSFISVDTLDTNLHPSNASNAFLIEDKRKWDYSANISREARLQFWITYLVQLKS